MNAFMNFKSAVMKNFESGINPSNPVPDSVATSTTASADVNQKAGKTTDEAAEEQVAEKHVTTNTKEKATLFANKMFGMAAKASHKLQEKAAANLSPMAVIANIEKERKKFMEELQNEKNTQPGCQLSQLLSNVEAKQHIISISAETKNFTEEPPLKFDLESDVEEIKACSKQLFELDPRLKEVRFALVPQQISEEKFWRNYAYKLSLVKKVLPTPEIKPELKSQTAEQPQSCSSDIKVDEDQDTLEKELNDWDEFEVVNGNKKEEETKLADDELDKEIDALLEDGAK